MVLVVLGLVILDPSFNRPFPHSCEQKHTVEGVVVVVVVVGGGVVTKYSDLYFLRLKPGFRFMVCVHCLRQPPR